MARSFINFRSPVNIVAAGLALSITLVILFVICALAANLFPDYRLSHNGLGLFTLAPRGSAQSYVEGIVWSILFAWVIAIIFGLAYNRLAKR